MYGMVLVCLGIMNMVLLAVFIHGWPKMTAVSRLGFGGVVFAWFPLFWGAAMVQHGLHEMKRVDFCNSCHPMESYVASLNSENEESLPALHFQNNYVDQKTACYACHTEYTMFGDVKAKLSGLKHVWIYYFGEVPDKIKLYQPYANRDCERCHATSKKYLEAHEDDLEDIQKGEYSCLECHDTGHVLGEGHGAKAAAKPATAEPTPAATEDASSDATAEQEADGAEEAKNE